MDIHAIKSFGNKQQFEEGLRQNEQVTTQPDDTVKTVAIYPAEENRMPYDIVIQTIGSKSPTLDAVEPERSTLELAGNFHITDDDLGVGGPKQKFARNIEAIRTLFKLEEEHRGATAEEQQVLSQYVGWGGLADAFDPSKDSWAKEYAELKGLLSEDEYAAARSSTLNAHYTSPTVIRSIYDAVERMGFHSGNILEPSMGVGNFFGMLPDSMADSRLYGVELDSITGRIAKKLYPQADITVAGFETTDRRDFYDLAVGNVPFGQYKVNDKAYNKLGFSIHNYFFAKAIDQVRPGGIIAFVTSRYTMDSKDSTARKHMAERADLLGAIRLPNNAFRANAGTDVVSDIIFLQKRDRPIDHEPDWVQLGKTEDGFAINQYFVDHPEMILGELTTESTQYGREELTVAPIEGAVLADQLAEAVQHIEGQYVEVEVETPDVADAEVERKTLPADPDVKNFSYAVVDGEVYYRENSIMTQVELSDNAKARVTGMVELRQIVNQLIQEQLDDYPDEDIKATQAKLNTAYDVFTAKYGLLNDRKNGRLFEDDSSYYLLCSLENLDENKQLKSKADMFTKRTIRPERTVTSVDTPSEALAVSIGEHGRVDLPYMAELLGSPGDYERITAELQGVIFKDPSADADEPEAGWQTADEYLSGNVRNKLRMAQLAAESHPEFKINVEALTKAQPKDLEASEIDIRLGATWLNPAIVQQFMMETFQPPYRIRYNNLIQVRYSPFTSEWRIGNKSAAGMYDIMSTETYGTHRANAYKILEDTLNLRDCRIYDTIEEDGKERRVLNQKETMLAQQKQQAIKDTFAGWVWQDPQRRNLLVKQYNELFNSTRPREYDGSHIHFVGMNPEINLREHQRNAVAHVLYGGNTLLAHEVGAGKSFEMAASAMESKRLGLCQKSLFVVPNHLTEQWASEFLRLYPNAKLLVTSKKDFEPANRKRFCARIATGDYDAVIIGHSQFEKIPLSAERQARIIEDQIEEIEKAIAEAKEQSGEHFTVKQMEKTRKTLEVKLKKLQSTDRKDDVVTFEQLGVDGPQHIATYLNDSGYRARSGKCWHPSSIRGMVQNLTYTGVLRCGDARSELMPELQIISQQQFETAQRIRDNRSVRAAADAENRTPLNIHGKSLLSGNAYCGHCGAKLELTSSRKWRKMADGSLDDTLRIRYTCYGKLRKQTNCTGQTGYTVHILDEIIDKAVRQIFSKMRGIPKEQIVTKRYEKENTERKNHLQDLQTQRNKAEKDLLALKTEVLACIKGESVLPRETLAEMITAQEEKLTELENLYEAASEELEKTAELMDKVSRLYDELISYADLYDSANFEAKKMIVNQLIRRVDVYRGYQINISFNFDLTPYIEGE